MSARSLSSLLTHLDAAGRRKEATRLDPALLEAAADAARRVGYAEGLAEGERRLATEKLRLAQTADEALAAARAAWAREEGAHLRARVDAALAELEALVTQSVAAALRPALAAAVAEAAVAALAVEARRLLDAADGQAVLRISAPADMMAALRDALGASPRIEFVESEGPDAVACLGRATVETRLARWTKRLAPPEA